MHAATEWLEHKLEAATPDTFCPTPDTLFSSSLLSSLVLSDAQSMRFEYEPSPEPLHVFAE